MTRFEVTHISSRESARLNRAIDEVQEIAGGVLIALVFIHGDELFMHLRPDYELDVAKALAEIDWKGAVPVVAEHIP